MVLKTIMGAPDFIVNIGVNTMFDILNVGNTVDIEYDIYRACC